jgi:hypothetical protein
MTSKLPIVGFLALMWLVLFGVANIGGAYDDLACQRASNTCTLTHRNFWLFGHSTWRFAVADLRGAEVASRSPDTFRTAANVVALDVRGQPDLTLTRLDVRTRSSLGRDALGAQASAINTFVATPAQPTLDVAEGDPTPALLTAFGVGALGTWVVLRGLRRGNRRRR